MIKRLCIEHPTLIKKNDSDEVEIRPTQLFKNQCKIKKKIIMINATSLNLKNIYIPVV